MSEHPEQDADSEPTEEGSEHRMDEAVSDEADDSLFGPEAEEDEAVLFDLPGDERTSELEAELAEVRDQLLRAVAETENVRRRAQREKEDAGKYAIASFAREMLSVSDNLVRALDSERANEEQQANSELDSAALLERFNNFILGVQMTETEMQKTFERIGIEKIEPVGTPFDPKLHHAMFEVEDPEKPSGTVMHVVESGYVLRERLLREAKVGVSKGGPKAQVAGPAQESASGEAEGAAQAYEQQAGPGSKVDTEL